MPRFDPVILQARWMLGGVSAEELASQALVALQRGFAGIALQQLAGLERPVLADLENLPQRAFADMGLTALNREEAVSLLVSRGEPTTGGIFLLFLNAFPAFSDRWRKHIEWWGGEPAGAYNDMAEFVRFVVEDLYGQGKLDDLHTVFGFLNRLVAEGDQETRDLVGWGFLETLQNVASWTPNSYKEFEQFLGPETQQMWQEIQKTWVGKSSLADVIRAERGEADA